MSHSDGTLIAAASQQWKPLALPGVALVLLRECDGERTVLLRMEPGARFPLHAHPAGEQLYVLSGGAEIGGRALAAGDYLYTPAGAAHDVSSAHGCVLFITVPRPIEILARAA